MQTGDDRRKPAPHVKGKVLDNVGFERAQKTLTRRAFQWACWADTLSNESRFAGYEGCMARATISALEVMQNAARIGRCA